MNIFTSAGLQAMREHIAQEIKRMWQGVHEERQPAVPLTLQWSDAILRAEAAAAQMRVDVHNSVLYLAGHKWRQGNDGTFTATCIDCGLTETMRTLRGPLSHYTLPLCIPSGQALPPPAPPLNESMRRALRKLSGGVQVDIGDGYISMSGMAADVSSRRTGVATKDLHKAVESGDPYELVVRGETNHVMVRNVVTSKQESGLQTFTVEFVSIWKGAPAPLPVDRHNNIAELGEMATSRLREDGTYDVPNTAPHIWMINGAFNQWLICVNCEAPLPLAAVTTGQFIDPGVCDRKVQGVIKKLKAS